EAYSPEKTTDDDEETYWATDDDTISGTLELDLSESRTIKYVELQEYIKLGQRVKSFTIETRKGDQWTTVAKGTTIGYKKILKDEPIEAREIRITITDAKACPLISSIKVY